MRLAQGLDRVASFWLVFWFAFIGVYIHMGALAFAGLVILLGAAGWMVWGMRRQDYPVFHKSFRLPLILFSSFFLWLALSSAWSASGPGTAIRVAAQLALSLSIPVLILSRRDGVRQRLTHIFMAMAVAGVAIMALDVASGYGLNIFLDPVGPEGDLNKRQGDAEKNIGRGLLTYAVMAPLLIALFASHLQRRWAVIASLGFLSVLLIGAELNRLSVVPMILIGGAAFFWLGLKSPRWGVKASAGLLAGSVLFAPLIGVLSRLAGADMMERLPMSWDHRLRMWDYVLTRIGDAPLIGHGLDSSRTMQEGFTTRIGVDVPFVSLHPHNLGLQTWLEAGAVGAVLLSLAIVSFTPVLGRLGSQNPWRSAALSGLIASMTIASAITVGAWQYWWWGLIVLSFSLVLLIPREPVLLLNSRTE